MQNRQSKLTIGYAPNWVKQSAINVPIPASYLTKAMPVTSKNYLDVQENVEDVFDCTGEDFLFEILLNRQARLILEMDVDPDILAGFTAFGFGVAGAPSGGTNEVQTETLTATGGSRILVVQTGANAQPTAAIAWNANAAAIQAALEALPNVAPGDVTVAQATGGGTITNTYTFGGAFAKQEVSLITVYPYALTGGTSTFAETTAGVGQSHELNRISAVGLPMMTLYVGYRDSGKQPKIFKNVVVNSIRVRSSNNGGEGQQKVTATVELIGSADLQYATGYTMSECQDILPLRFGDCGMNLAGTDLIAANLGREFEFGFDNQAVVKFDGTGVDFTRAERADRRQITMNWFILGEPADDDSNYKLAEMKSTLPASLRIGPNGRKVTYIVPSGYYRLASTPIRHNGNPPESEIAAVIRPKKVPGNSTTPIYAQAVSAQATAFLGLPV